MAEQRVEPPFKPTIESDPPQDVQFGEEGPPSALVPFVDKTSSQDRGQRPHQSRRSSCEERSLDESEQEADQHLVSVIQLFCRSGTLLTAKSVVAQLHCTRFLPSSLRIA